MNRRIVVRTMSSRTYNPLHLIDSKYRDSLNFTTAPNYRINGTGRCTQLYNKDRHPD